MLSLRKKAEEFLKKYGMNPADVDLDRNCDIFVREMQNGLDGSGSLLMIPTYIGIEKELPVNEPIIAVDAGGTNFRVAVVHFDENRKPVIEDFKLYPMPGTKGEISKEEFFETMADYIQPVIDRSNKISFSFSYAAETMPDRDGKIIFFSKEVRIRNIKGELLGRNLLDVFKKRGVDKEIEFIALNDTVATLLAGKAASPDRIFDSYIGFILGTGTNICYAERSSNIVKVPELKDRDGLMLINMETGSYNKEPRSKLDIDFDSTTVNPGECTYEKTISGAYQGGLALTVIRRAAEDGLLTPDFAAEFRNVKELVAKELDDFLFYPYGDNVLARCCAKSDSDVDRRILYYLIDAVFERIAKFVVFSLAAVIEKTGRGTDPCRPVCITADGSTFYKSKLFRSKLDHYVKTYMNEARELYCEFVKVDNGTLIGTAIAGLIN
ncbi:MAG TPA: hexokinase [Clostridia bacterium]|nr:hexokinase [Clostridia bacterium]